VTPSPVPQLPIDPMNAQLSYALAQTNVDDRHRAAARRAAHQRGLVRRSPTGSPDREP